MENLLNEKDEQINELEENIDWIDSEKKICKLKLETLKDNLNDIKEERKLMITEIDYLKQQNQGLNREIDDLKK